MSDLYAFLNPIETEEEKEVIVSKRFVGKDGKPQPFRIKSLTQADNERITKAATRVYKENGQRMEKLDSVDFGRRMVLEATIFPNFADKALCERYKTLDPAEVPGKMLRAGEYATLLRVIMDFSGFNQDLGAMEDAAKN